MPRSLWRCTSNRIAASLSDETSDVNVGRTHPQQPVNSLSAQPRGSESYFAIGPS